MARADNGPSLSKANYSASKPVPLPSDDELIRRQNLAEFKEGQREEAKAKKKAFGEAVRDAIERKGFIRFR